MYLDQLAIPNCWLKVLLIIFIRIFTEGLAKTCLPITQFAYFATDTKEIKLFYYLNIAFTFLNCAGPETDHVTYVGSASPLIADIKTEPYSLITYFEYGTLIGTYDNTYDIPIYVDNGTTLNIMPMHFYEKAFYLHHFPKEHDTIRMIHTGNRPIKTRFSIDILLNIQGCMLQFKLLVCDTKAETGILFKQNGS